MEYVKGIRATVMNTGTATARSDQSTCRALLIIIAPITTSAAAATCPGTIWASGVKNRPRREQHAGDDGGQAGAGALADAGRGLDEDGLPRGARDAADRAAGAVHEQRLGQARHPAAFVGEPGLGADADDGGHRVEEPGEHQGEDDHADRHAADRAPAAELDVPEEREVRHGHRAALQLGRGAAPGGRGRGCRPR